MYKIVTRCHSAGGHRGVYTHHIIDTRTGKEVSIEEVYYGNN